MDKATTCVIDVVNPIIGDAMTITIPVVQKASSTVSMRIWYTTKPEAQAFSWTEPTQTAGGVLHYFYTHCGDINSRSVAPQMDTPLNHVTYVARVMTQNDLLTKMSANEAGVMTLNITHNVASFYCAIPIPN